MTDLPNSGMRLGADLYGLWRAGQLHLPALADEFMAASDAAAQTDVGLTNAFMRPSAFGGGSYGPVYQPWCDLRNELIKILSETSANLELTGEALQIAATEYARTDAEAADEFTRLRQIDGDSIP